MWVSVAIGFSWSASRALVAHAAAWGPSWVDRCDLDHSGSRQQPCVPRSASQTGANSDLHQDRVQTRLEVGQRDRLHQIAIYLMVLGEIDDVAPSVGGQEHHGRAAHPLDLRLPEQLE